MEQADEAGREGEPYFDDLMDDLEAKDRPRKVLKAFEALRFAYTRLTPAEQDSITSILTQ